MRLQVQVTPRSRAPGIEPAPADGVVRVRVREAPEEGKANEAVLRALGARLGIPRGSMRLIGGATSRRKWVEISGFDEEEIWRRLRP